MFALHQKVDLRYIYLMKSFKDTGCSEMGHLGFGVVLDAGDSYRQTVLIGLEGALSRYM
jgi:hypothetical protein